MIKAIIFDADGVLIQTKMFSEQYCREFNISLEAMLPFFTGTFQECLVGKADLKQEVKKHLAEWKWNKSVDEFLDYWFKAEHSINETLVQSVQNLKKQKIICCLGTNQEKYRTEYMIEKMGFKKIFDHIFSSAYLGYKKPESQFFQIIIEKLKLPPEQILLWDDTTEHIKSAKAFGMHAEFYSTYENFSERMKQYHLKI